MQRFYMFSTIGCVEIVVIAAEAMVEEMPLAPLAASPNSDIWWTEYLLLFKGRPIKRVSINVLQLYCRYVILLKCMTCQTKI